MKIERKGKVAERVGGKPSLAPLYLVVFLDVLGFGIIIPVLRDYTEFLVHASGYKEVNMAFMAGILMSSYSIAQFLFAPVLGWFSDKYGRRLILIVSVAGNVLSYFLWMISSSYGLFLISRIVSGITGGNISVAQSYVADVTSREERAKTMAVLGAFFGIGFTFGPFIGGLLSSFDLTNYNLFMFNFNQFSMVGFAVFLLSFINLLWILAKVQETNSYALGSENSRQQTKVRKTVGLFAIWKELKRPILGRLFLINFLEMIAFVTFESVMVWLLKDKFNHDTRMTGYFFAYIGILMSLVQGGLYRFLIRRSTERKLLPIGFGLMALSFLLLPFLPYYSLVLVLMIPFTIAVGIINPSLNALASLYSHETEQGVNLGLLQGFGAVARAIAPLAATYLYGDFSMSLPFVIAGFLALVILVFLIPSLPEGRGFEPNELSNLRLL